MTLREIGFSNEVGKEPPDAVLNEPLEQHLPNVKEFNSVAYAFEFHYPTTHCYTFYFFNGDIDKNRRPDEILTFRIKNENLQKVAMADDFLGGLVFGKINAPPLAERQYWKVGTQSEEGKKAEEQAQKSGCFIATAAYGSSSSKEVIFLSKFRDDILLNNSIGKLFIKFYYFVSPFIANVIKKSSFLKNITRAFLIHPIISLIKISKINKSN